MWTLSWMTFFRVAEMFMQSIMQTWTSAGYWRSIRKLHFFPFGSRIHSFELGGWNFGFWFFIYPPPTVKWGGLEAPHPPPCRHENCALGFLKHKYKIRGNPQIWLEMTPLYYASTFVEVISLQLALVRLTLLLTLFSIPSSRLHPSPLVRLPHSPKLPHLPLMMVPF